MSVILHEIVGATAGILLTAAVVALKPYIDRYSPKVKKAHALAKALDIKMIEAIGETGFAELAIAAAERFDDEEFSRAEVLELLPLLKREWSLSSFSDRLNKGN